MATEKRTPNRVPGLIGVSSTDGSTPIVVYADETTHRLLVDVALAGVTDLTGVTDGELVNAADKGALLMGTDGSNYQALAVNSSGHLLVDLQDTSMAVTNTGTFAVQATLGAETTKVIGTINVSAGQTIAVTNAGITTIAGAVSGSEMQVDVLTLPAVTATNLDIRDLTSASDSVEVKQATGTNLHVVVDTAPTTAVTGTFYQATQPVSLASVPSHAVTNAGTFAVQDSATETSLAIMDDWDSAASDSASVSGDTAHDAADAGEPVKIGFKVETSPKGITVCADADRTNAYADADGMQMVKVNTSGADLISERVSNTNGTSTDFTNFSAVASTYNYVTAITVYNSSTTDGYVDFRSSTDGAVLWTMPLPALGGSCISSTTPLFKTVVGDALSFDVSGAITTTFLSVSGFQSKV